MKKKFLVFRDERGGAEDGGPLPKQENELQEGGAGAAETSGANAQVAGSQGEDYINEERLQEMKADEPIYRGKTLSEPDYSGETNIQPGSTPQGTTTED